MVDLTDMFGGAEAGTGLLGLPLAEAGAPGADVVVFGADCATPYPSVGAYCAGGPAAIRSGAAPYGGDMARVNFDLMGPILAPDVRAVDAGDLAVDPQAPESNRSRICDTTRAVLDHGAVPVLLGGDDSVPIPFLQAYEGRGPLTVLQIDAHIDWRDEVQGTRWGLSSTMRRASEMDHVARIVQVGARGVGSAGMGALQAARDWGAHLIPAYELDTGGLERAVSLIPEGSDVIICLDVDALDPAIMPAVIAPTAGGLSYAQTLALIRGVAGRARIAGFDMVEFKPDADRDGIGARTAGQLLTSVLGVISRQVAERR